MFSSALSTVVKYVRFLFLLVVFFVRMWLLYACFLLIFPVPVSVNLFFAPELVFILGIFFSFF